MVQTTLSRRYVSSHRSDPDLTPRFPLSEEFFQEEERQPKGIAAPSWTISTPDRRKPLRDQGPGGAMVDVRRMEQEIWYVLAIFPVLSS